MAPQVGRPWRGGDECRVGDGALGTRVVHSDHSVSCSLLLLCYLFGF